MAHTLQFGDQVRSDIPAKLVEREKTSGERHAHAKTIRELMNQVTDISKEWWMIQPINVQVHGREATDEQYEQIAGLPTVFPDMICLANTYDGISKDYAEIVSSLFHVLSPSEELPLLVKKRSSQVEDVLRYREEEIAKLPLELSETFIQFLRFQRWKSDSTFSHARKVESELHEAVLQQLPRWVELALEEANIIFLLMGLNIVIDNVAVIQKMYTVLKSGLREDDEHIRLVLLRHNKNPLGIEFINLYNAENETPI